MSSLALDSREMAALLWLSIFMLWCLSLRKVRASLPALFRTAMHPKIAVPILVMLGYIALEVWLGYHLSLWTFDLLKPTLLWVGFSAFSMFFAFEEASKNPHFIRHSVVKALGIAAFLEFFMNIAPMHFVLEFALQPMLAALTMLSIVAGSKNEYRSTKRASDSLIALIGLALLAYTANELYDRWGGLDKQNLLLQLALPAWLSIGLVPYIYVLGFGICQ